MAITSGQYDKVVTDVALKGGISSGLLYSNYDMRNYLKMRGYFEKKLYSDIVYNEEVPLVSERYREMLDAIDEGISFKDYLLRINPYTDTVLKNYDDFIDKFGLYHSDKRYYRKGTIKYDYYQKLKDRKAYTDSQMFQLRLESALSEAIQNDFYPLFVTLTLCDNSVNAFEHIVGKRENALASFRRKFARKIIADFKGISVRQVEKNLRENGEKVDDFVEYAQIMEKGDKNGRIHYHLLYIVKCDLPDAWIAQKPIFDGDGRYSIVGAENCWQYGRSEVRPCRYGERDVWKRKFNWDVPLEKVGLYSPQKLSGYLTKYSVKKIGENISCLKKLRRSMSRNFGLKGLKEIILKNPKPSLMGIIPNQLKKMTGKRIPKQQWMKLAWRVILPQVNLEVVMKILKEECETRRQKVHSNLMTRKALNYKKPNFGISRYRKAQDCKECLDRISLMLDRKEEITFDRDRFIASVPDYMKEVLKLWQTR